MEKMGNQRCPAGAPRLPFLQPPSVILTSYATSGHFAPRFVTEFARITPAIAHLTRPASGALPSLRSGASTTRDRHRLRATASESVRWRPTALPPHNRPRDTKDRQSGESTGLDAAAFPRGKRPRCRRDSARRWKCCGVEAGRFAAL